MTGMIPQHAPIEMQLVAVAQEMMTRADLKGREVDSYAKAFNFLQDFIDGKLIAMPKDRLLGMEKALADFEANTVVVEDSPEAGQVVLDDVDLEDM